jgi:hypothetical protein
VQQEHPGAERDGAVGEPARDGEGERAAQRRQRGDDECRQAEQLTDGK